MKQALSQWLPHLLIVAMVLGGTAALVGIGKLPGSDFFTLAVAILGIGGVVVGGQHSPGASSSG